MRIHTLLITLCLIASSTAPLAAQDLTVLPADAAAPPRQMMRRYLAAAAEEAFARRAQDLARVQTADQLRAYQQQRRQIFFDALGPMPARTPLNARNVGTLQEDGYRIEKIIFESQPGHLVTGNLYVPAGEGPFPAVLVPCGHSQSGKAAQQSICLSLVSAGFIAFSYDPIGQGERTQLIKPDGKPLVGMTTEHTLLGSSSTPVGRSAATYRIFDGFRAIDYLVSREEVDAAKIGVTGVSGGGTMTSFLMALDERVACAAPSCYITSYPRLLATIGPQDAEQNIFGQIARGLDHADYLIMRAPKPTLILAGTQDFFDIQGTWDSFRQAQRAYTRLDAGERVAIIETDTKHGYPKAQREAMVRWMKRWMLGKDEPWTEPQLKTRPERDLLCTDKGQVMLLDGAVSVVDLNVALAKEIEAKRRELWKPEHQAETLKQVRRISGIRELANLPVPKSQRIAIVSRAATTIEKIIIEPEPGIQLPALLFKPAKANGQRTLYLHGSGKHVDAGAEGEIEKLVATGITVLAVDLRGMGETGLPGPNLWGGDWNDIFVSYLLGRSLVAMRAEDVIASARFLAGLAGDGQDKPVNLIAIATATPPALHAAALERKLFQQVQIQSPAPATWLDAVANPERGNHFAHVIHGALAVYDLPDLADIVTR